MPSNEAMKFDRYLHHMHLEADSICHRAWAMANSEVRAELYDFEEIKRAAVRLRWAADYLDDIRRRLQQQPKPTGIKP